MFIIRQQIFKILGKCIMDTSISKRVHILMIPVGDNFIWLCDLVDVSYDSSPTSSFSGKLDYQVREQWK